LLARARPPGARDRDFARPFFAVAKKVKTHAISQNRSQNLCERSPTFQASLI
jgi:hypothetical protein